MRSTFGRLEPAETQTGAVQDALSPDVIRALHADYVRDQRRRAVLLLVLTPVAALIMYVGFQSPKDFGPLVWLGMAVMAAAGRQFYEWLAVRVDPAAGG